MWVLPASCHPQLQNLERVLEFLHLLSWAEIQGRQLEKFEVQLMQSDIDNFTGSHPLSFDM